MISLKDKILNEGILTSTAAGKEGLRGQIEEWLKRNNISNYEIDQDSLNVRFKAQKTVLEEPIPDFMHVTAAGRLIVHSKEALKNLPDLVGDLIIENIEIDDFTDISDVKCFVLAISNCDIKSLKGIPTPFGSNAYLIIGNNKQNFSKKDLKKAGVALNPNRIDNVGYLNLDYGHSTLIGDNDQIYLTRELEQLKAMYKRLIPEMKLFAYNCKKENTHVYMRIDFLSEEEHPNHISDNSIFIGFKYSASGSVLESGSMGHLELTPEDKAGKYKYYALKGITAPYIDNGGKRFRAVRLDQFTAKNVFDKTKDWVRAVVDAALKDQGGTLKRK